MIGLKLGGCYGCFIGNGGLVRASVFLDQQETKYIHVTAVSGMPNIAMLLSQPPECGTVE
jgi:hypothetical protein